MSIQAESETPAVTRWVRMKVGRKYGLRQHLKVLSVGESLISRGKLFQMFE